MRRAAALLALFALALAALGGMSARLWPDAAAPAETLLVYGDAAALEGAVLSYSGELAGHVEWSAPAGESAAHLPVYFRPAHGGRPFRGPAIYGRRRRRRGQEARGLQ